MMKATSKTKQTIAKKAYSAWKSSTKYPAANQALSRMLQLAAADPRLAASFSVLYAEMARARSEGDNEAVAYAQRAIADLCKPIGPGRFDRPLFPRRSRRAAEKS
jgi:hypothetical protein